MAQEKDTEQKFFERQLVIFRIGKEEFGVDISDVKEIIKLENTTHIPETEDYVEGIINLRGKIVTIIDLSKKLAIGSIKKNDNTRVLVTEIRGSTLGFVIDSCNEVLRLTGDKIESAPKIITNKINADYIQGVGLIDNRLIVIIDLGKIMSDKEITQLSKNSKKNKLLIVEDSTMMRGTLKSYIDSGAFDIIEAENGEDGITAFDNENPSVVLLDIKLPKMNGVEVLKYIIKKKPSTKVIMETSVYEEETKKECLEIGAKAYLKKPINKKELETLLLN
jgi:purine-binding chemotaxis protein CheW